MKDIKKVADKYQSENGHYTNKDLLWYIVKRIDDLENRNNEKDIEQDNRISKSESKITMLCWIVPIILTIIGLVAVI